MRLLPGQSSAVEQLGCGMHDSLPVFLWISVFVLLINEQDLVVDRGSENLETFDVQFCLSFRIKAPSDTAAPPNLGE